MAVMLSSVIQRDAATWASFESLCIVEEPPGVLNGR
ncbi:hypothetical protein BBOH_0374 [Bifidobacterium bohemicum DSM 22767]|uniref:Uncharacterized protein n=1 Tax=Bifidobacterium bohemicum DSM 22767 TaxID=1437606 RepID=A0A086ZK50_9BIFI|nr:hypothetical protein BBOH_0374 [Bifidobacterium bohemicum DSM 22767]